MIFDLVTPQPDTEGLADFLASSARRSSDGRLAAHAGAGLVVAIAAVLWGGSGWSLLAALGLCSTAFGAWGILDRELGERRGNPEPIMLRGLVVARVLAAVMGIAAALAALFGALALTLGTWIS